MAFTAFVFLVKKALVFSTTAIWCKSVFLKYSILQTNVARNHEKWGMLLSKILQKFLKKKKSQTQLLQTFWKLTHVAKAKCYNKKKTYGGTSALMVEKEK